MLPCSDSRELLGFTFAEIKLEKFKEAVEDCTAVLKLEPLNTKGLVCVAPVGF